MIVEPLSMRHKEILSRSLHAINTPVSEYSFANLYLFRNKHDYNVISGDETFITGRAYNGDRYAMPTSDVRSLAPETLDTMIKRYGMIFPVLEEWLPIFAPNKYAVTFDDAESDYLHSVEKMANYAGNRLHDKKNLLNQFVKRYSSRAVRLTSDLLNDAREILDMWQEGSVLTKDDTDYNACSEALSLYEELSLCGVIYYVDGIPAGFIIGEELGSSVFALHFVKAKKEFKGIYQFMYHQFARIMPLNYVAFNFEQDLGIGSLRQSKASYQPEKMLKKYRVRLKPPVQ